MKHLPEKIATQCQYCSDFLPTLGMSFQAHALTQQHIQNVHNFVVKNETHPDGDDDDDEMDIMKQQQMNEKSFQSMMTSQNMSANEKFDASYHHAAGIESYTNIHPQKPLLVGDMHWID